LLKRKVKAQQEERIELSQQQQQKQSMGGNVGFDFKQKFLEAQHSSIVKSIDLLQNPF
jgi:hypothetical protein